MKKPEQKKEEQVVAPQLTFTEKEFEDFKAFLNVVASKASFTFTTRDSHEYSRLYVAALQLEKKIYDHILEVKRVVHRPQKEGKE